MKKVLDYIKGFFTNSSLNKKTLIIGSVIVLVSILIDQITKIYMENLLEFEIPTNVFRLSYCTAPEQKDTNMLQSSDSSEYMH